MIFPPERILEHIRPHLLYWKAFSTKWKQGGKKRSCAQGSGEGVNLVSSKVPFSLTFIPLAFWPQDLCLCCSFPNHHLHPNPFCPSMTISTALKFQWSFILFSLAEYYFFLLGIFMKYCLVFQLILFVLFTNVYFTNCVRHIGTMLPWSKRWTRQVWSSSPGSSDHMQGEAGQDKGQRIEEGISLGTGVGLT